MVGNPDEIMFATRHLQHQGKNRNERNAKRIIMAADFASLEYVVIVTDANSYHFDT